MQHYCNAYRSAILNTFLLLVRPYAYFNEYLDYYQTEGTPEDNGFFKFNDFTIDPRMREIDSHLVHHGAINDLLVGCFCFIRVWLFLRSILYLFFDNLVQHDRVSEIMGFPIHHSFLFRFYYHGNQASTIAWVTITFLAVFMVLLLDYEGFQIPTFFDQIWYLLITMTTVGYGDYFTKNVFGNYTIVIVVFLGQILSSLFVLVLTDILSMDQSDKLSMDTIKKIYINMEMKRVVVDWLSCEVKIKTIKKIRIIMRQKDYGDYELYRLMTQSSQARQRYRELKSEQEGLDDIWYTLFGKYQMINDEKKVL